MEKLNFFNDTINFFQKKTTLNLGIVTPEENRVNPYPYVYITL